MNSLYAFDAGFRKQYALIAGVDEAGRGPLAGPVVAAAVILDHHVFLPNVKDSKLLSESAREHLFMEILCTSLALGIGVVDHQVIDTINILQAAKLAMKKAVVDLNHAPDLVLVDAVSIPDLTMLQKAFVKGESHSASIAAASIVAKVIRDGLMRGYHKLYPEYNFKQHKGYPTKEHLANIRLYGPCPVHRKTFKGVKT
ncbi:MAG TPA: ribonuclease HII [Thermodesulfovibrionia bacterium]|nr:ribonuclease HII [Thermodesulfovibrionia bacterium]